MAQVEQRTSRHVVGDMRRRIGEGLWRPEQMLPGRRALAAEYGVALATLERAVAVLMAEGLLRADKRRGTFVAAPDGLPGEPVLPPDAVVSRGPLAATVAVVAAVDQGLPGDAAPWALNILRACEDQLGTVPGMTVRFVNASLRGAAARSPATVVEEVRRTEPDGVILISNFAQLHDALSGLIARPVVSVVFDPEEAASRQVTVDEPYGGLQAARHLINQGYRKLLFFQPFDAVWVASRLAGVRAAVVRAAAATVSLRVWPEVQGPLPANEDSPLQAVLAHEAAKALPDGGFEAGLGVIAPNDFTAVGYMRAAAERGLSAGTDYGIIGFDDYERRADLSTLRPPLEQLGAEAARLMERVLRGEGGPSRVMVHHRLIPRGSTRRQGE